MPEWSLREAHGQMMTAMLLVVVMVASAMTVPAAGFCMFPTAAAFSTMHSARNRSSSV